MLTPDEKLVWETYVSKAPLTDISTVESYINPIKVTKTNAIENNKQLIRERVVLSPHQILIDKKIYSKLQSGQLQPERTLDLHGFTYDRAKSQVETFINRAYLDEKRLLLVITGKGNKSSNSDGFSTNSRVGILKRAFPAWLKTGVLKTLVLNVISSHYSHGGSGAYYVYLRKKKLKNIVT